MSPLRRYRYSRVAPLHYEVRYVETGAYLGEIWTTREGWITRKPDGTTEEHYGVSRDVAASALRV